MVKSRGLTPIIECAGIKNNSHLDLSYNPLSEITGNEQIKILKNRGVYVLF